MSKTLGLALGSGGARGIAHIGFVKALEEEGIKPDYISGCSMGAVVGCCLAKGITCDELKEIALKLKPRDIIDVSPAILTSTSLLRSQKIVKLLTQYIGDTNIEDLQIPFQCVATDILSGKLITFKEGSAYKAVQASSAIPGVFRPVVIDDYALVDGGCLCRVPIRAVKDMGADVVVALDVLKNTEASVEKVSNILGMVLRVFDIMDNASTKLHRELEKDLCDLYLEPEMQGLSQYEIKNLDKAYDEGYEVGKQNVEKIKELLK